MLHILSVYTIAIYIAKSTHSATHRTVIVAMAVTRFLHSDCDDDCCYQWFSIVNHILHHQTSQSRRIITKY